MLLSTKVKIKWNSRIKKHYVDLGYNFTKMGEEFEVDVNHLTDGSNVRVVCSCDYCNSKYDLSWYSYKKMKKKEIAKDYCNSAICTTKKSQETLIKKYGTYNIREIPEVNEKIKKTNISIYGCENPFGNKDVQNKIKEFYLNQYGVEHNMQIESVLEKSKNTCQTNYGVDFYVEALKGQYIGENSPRWKGEDAIHERTERNSFQYHEWRTKVFERDLYTCKCCGVKNGNGKYIRLEAHHIKNWKDNIDSRFELNNGITLCQDCHINFHKLYGKKNNTNRQLEEFLNDYDIDKKIC